MLREKEYSRQAAKEYANYWAYRRNPIYYNFNEIGGDCTNFVSQCLYAGSEVMNYTPTYGWYYIDLNNRAPAWTGVNELYQFLTSNKTAGPYGIDSNAESMMIGDVIQMKINHDYFHHSVLVVSTGETPSLENILVASHYKDANNRPILTYDYTDIRFIHIEGVRYYG